MNGHLSKILQKIFELIKNEYSNIRLMKLIRKMLAYFLNQTLFLSPFLNKLRLYSQQAYTLYIFFHLKILNNVYKQGLNFNFFTHQPIWLLNF